MHDMDQMEWTGAQWDHFLRALKAAATLELGDGRLSEVDGNAIFEFEREGGEVLTLIVDGTTDEPPKADIDGQFYSVLVYEASLDQKGPPKTTLRVSI
jgi:hypothetical protein